MSKKQSNTSPPCVQNNWPILLRCFEDADKDDLSLEEKYIKLLNYLRHPIKKHLTSACKEKHIRFEPSFEEEWNLRLIVDDLVEKENDRHKDGKLEPYFNMNMGTYYSRLKKPSSPLKAICRDFVKLNQGSGIPKNEAFFELIEEALNNNVPITTVKYTNYRERPSYKDLFPLGDYDIAHSEEGSHYENNQFSDDNRISLDKKVIIEIKTISNVVHQRQLEDILFREKRIIDFYSIDELGYESLRKCRARFLKSLASKMLPHFKNENVPWVFYHRYLICLGVKDTDMLNEKTYFES
ncbi:hypothetical protein [uncultured Croceitalea sp.]|uniref:hypothetical protein n=1 Tax=uncultured Croceitalea sp. TaxID=1798908 RepID=UPI0033058C26